MPLLDDSVHRILTERTDDAWPARCDAGLTAIGIPESLGGSGGDLADAAIVLRAVGYHAAAVPLAETWLAGRLLSAAGLAVPPGPLTVAGTLRGRHQDEEIRAEPEGGGRRLTGRPRRVPWAANADHIALAVNGPDGPLAALVEREAVAVEPGRNFAGEPRDDNTLDGVVIAAVPSTFTAFDLMLHGALARTVAMAGAARRILDLALRHSTEREQFGRPIARFQAVQQLLAGLAGEVTLLEVGAEAAAGRAAAAHQIHGAIGVTHEHMLRNLTLRLWSWREEYGSEAHWHDRIATAAGGDAWPLVCGEA
jgi:acyl-CoA dehydrogenase